MNEIKIPNLRELENTITREEFEEVGQVIKDAEETNTPVLFNKEDELNIVGDATETDIIPQDYEITFTFTEKEAQALPTDKYQIIDYEDIKDIDSTKQHLVKIGKEYYLTQKFENVYPKANQELSLMQSILKILPFYYAVEEVAEEQYKNIRELTKEERDAVYNELVFKGLTDDILSKITDVVATFLNIPTKLRTKILFSSTVAPLLKFMSDFPATVERAKRFFSGSPAEKPMQLEKQQIMEIIKSS